MVLITIVVSCVCVLHASSLTQVDLKDVYSLSFVLVFFADMTRLFPTSLQVLSACESEGPTLHVIKNSL